MEVLARRVGILVVTVLVTTALGHVFLNATNGESLSDAVTGTPAFLVDRFVHFDFGFTDGRRCSSKQGRDQKFTLCASYNPQTIGDMLRARVPVDVALLLGGLLIGTLVGVAGGRYCATHPRSRMTRVLHVLTAVQLATPVFLMALAVIFYFSSNVSEVVRLPFLSGQGQYVPLRENPLLYLRAMWIPWLVAALPLAAYVLRITELSLREDLLEDFVRTARAKGLYERSVVNRHALPVAAPAIAAMTGVNVSTMLINVAVIEYVYGLPGLFRVINNAASAPADVAVLEALVLEGVILIVVANMLVDLFQALLDPRVRLA